MIGAFGPWWLLVARASAAAPETVAEVVSYRHADLVACATLRAEGTPPGRLFVAWEVADGRAQDIRVVLDELGSSPVADCVVRAVSAWDFPAGVRSRVLWPLDFWWEPEVDVAYATERALVAATSSAMGYLKRCFDAAVLAHPTATGGLAMAWRIEGRKATRLEVVAAGAAPAALATCSRDALARWTFPEGLSGDVLMPYVGPLE